MRRIPLSRIAFTSRWLKIAFFALAAVVLFSSIGLYILTVSAANPDVNRPQAKRPNLAEPAPVEKPITLSDFSSVISKDKGSVVKIQGYGCGYEFIGSGFVVAPDLVATNAHAVA